MQEQSNFQIYLEERDLKINKLQITCSILTREGLMKTSLKFVWNQIKAWKGFKLVNSVEIPYEPLFWNIDTSSVPAFNRSFDILVAFFYWTSLFSFYSLTYIPSNGPANHNLDSIF